MAIDLSVYGKSRSLSDFLNANQDREMQQQLLQAQIQKSQQLDVDKLGEQAFLKAAQGIPLSPQEMGAARFIDAKSGGVGFDPATQTIFQKPRLSDKIGLSGSMAFPQAPQSQPIAGTAYVAPKTNNTQPAQALDPFEAQYQDQLRKAGGNNKLRQTIMENYAKEKLKYNEDQAKSAGFTDRMSQADPLIKNNEEAGTSWGQAALSSVPIVGNALISDERQGLEQAERNFINAQLRRESGAAISSGEFENARKQYFPQPGDSENVLKQKSDNRQTALQAMQRASGAAYVPPSPQSPAPSKTPKNGSVVDGYMFTGGDPSQQSNWKKVK